MSPVKNRRRVLCVFPRFSPCFASFHHAFPFFPGTVAFMPPQGILTIAAYLPAEWDVRVVDENVFPVTEDDAAWADVVMTSGMHVQRRRMAEIAELAHRHGKLAVAGGSSVSACPEYHSTYDLLQVGELGDSTDAIVARLDASLDPPDAQEVYTTDVRLDLDSFPIPAYEKVPLGSYMVQNIQWSSGCPYTCEFCDIPELYGRKPRTKSIPRLLAELDAIMAQRPAGGIWFVDDNLIGNKPAAKELLRALIGWQERHGYVLRLSGEATINMAQDEELLELMREAWFTDMYVGIESASMDTLATISKRQNTRTPLLDAIRTVNRYGIELSAGIIFGFDNDGPETGRNAIRFIEESGIPLVVLNVLYALPRTPLWRRLEKEGRLIPNAEAEESNVVFKLPQDTIVGMFREAVDAAYNVDALYRRFRYQSEHTWPNRKKLPLSRYPLSSPTVQMGLRAMGRVCWDIGMRGDYRGRFWRIAFDLAREGHLEHLVYMGAMGHHFIRYRDDILAGRIHSSTFSHKEGRLATG
jgi:radical SAM superfamily enzyme YgiQ (UPF0313 family)